MEQQYILCDLWKGARRDTFALSIVLHIAALAAVSVLTHRATVSVSHPDTSKAVTLVAPMPLVVTDVGPPKPKLVAPVVRAPLARVRKPELQAPPEAPKLNVETTRPETALPLSAAPRSLPAPAAQPGGFDPPKTTAVTTSKPRREVQTGGFGDPNGDPGEGKPGAALSMAKLGSFDLPSGPGAGNGSAGSHGVRGTVASAGFGTGVTDSSSGSARPQKRVAQSGFTDATVVADAPAKARPAAPKTTPVEILYKPRPVYTAEARSLRIEGEVLLDVVFLASGDLHVTRVASGLGHGLDQAATQAAQRIRFRPATKDGQPCDANATVHIVFQLAE